ncbi:DUF4334 domain-containing protein [Pseudonocardia humida]|uniref:DUF4334 domain-containing protein n=1 Tax=Pseudonocardia humida TaxID=2800819 RepID=A0ABT0ZT28_9PSEU|nr:DUF4334 domain-containing protein [Pseudonocardia humida]MCO1653840.1 DUF4334 domain-containing protein [Pseudonocardia humida]
MDAVARAERLRTLMRGATPDDVLAFFDGLPPVEVADLLGSWRGAELPTGHRLDGLLGRFGWHGKRFEGADAAHPLVFDDGRGGLVEVNPALVPLGLVVRLAGLLRNPVAAAAFRVVRPLLRTRRPRARVRMVRHRGVVSATMCYDALPVHDVFRRVDDDTLLGLMDLRGDDPPFAFVLRRQRA